jgi:hypothetical protein
MPRVVQNGFVERLPHLRQLLKTETVNLVCSDIQSSIVSSVNLRMVPSPTFGSHRASFARRLPRWPLTSSAKAWRSRLALIRSTQKHAIKQVDRLLSNPAISLAVLRRRSCDIVADESNWARVYARTLQCAARLLRRRCGEHSVPRLPCQPNLRPSRGAHGRHHRFSDAQRDRHRVPHHVRDVDARILSLFPPGARQHADLPPLGHQREKGGHRQRLTRKCHTRRRNDCVDHVGLRGRFRTTLHQCRRRSRGHLPHQRRRTL